MLTSHTANFIQDTTSFTDKRVLDNLPGFIEKFADDPEKLGKPPKKNGAPHTIIVAGAGLRAANIVRSVPPLFVVGATI